jgi:glycosyltransferase involved in cell wall biosynthesis
MPKVIIQIPCYNEADTLGVTLRELPRSLPGVDQVEWLIIDDGSTDKTVEVARAHGVDHIVCLGRHQGLARAFVAGLEACLLAGADIIVNTDGDNQYCAQDIAPLIAPLLEGRADLVVGARSIEGIAHFSRLKKLLQRLGSWIVRRASNTRVPDATSGFRAFSRHAAMRLHVFNEYSPSIEILIQAGQKGMAVVSVPIRVNKDLRPSRLIRNIPDYIVRQTMTILRIFVTYRAFRFFAISGLLLFAAGFIIGLRFLYAYMTGEGTGHVQSLILSALLMGTGFFLGVIGLVADLVAVNRQLLERIDYRLQVLEEKLERPPRE